MCTCETNTKAPGVDLGAFFEKNKPAVAKVLKKYNLSHYPLNLYMVASIAHSAGGSLKQEVAEAIAGESQFSNYNANAANISSAVFSAIGQVANAGIGIYKEVAGAKANTSTTQAPSAPVYTPAPTAPTDEPKRYFGFSAGQLGLLGAAIALVAVILYMNKE